MPKYTTPRTWSDVHGNPHGQEPEIMTSEEFLQQLKDPKSKTNQLINNQIAIAVAENDFINDKLNEEFLQFLREKEVLKQLLIKSDAHSSWSLVTPEMFDSDDIYFNQEQAFLINEIIVAHNNFLLLQTQYDVLFKQSIQARTDFYDKQLDICSKAIQERINCTTDPIYRQQIEEARETFLEGEKREPALRRDEQARIEQAYKEGDQVLVEELMRATPNRLQRRYKILFAEMTRNCPKEFEEENARIIDGFQKDLKEIITQDKKLKDVQTQIRDLASHVEERRQALANLQQEFGPKSNAPRMR